MTGTLILVRHGETEGNVARILDTQLPGLPLTQRGITQAKSFGAGLPLPPAALLSSAALRARQTAGYIEEAIGVTAEVVPDVHEVQVGELEGQGSAQAHEHFLTVSLAWHAGRLSERPPGGESGREVLDRFIPALTGLRDQYLTAPDARNVLLISHGAAMRLVARELTGVGMPHSAEHYLDNTETIELLPRPDGSWQLLRWGRHTPPFPLR